jgi:hypothetical protein
MTRMPPLEISTFSSELGWMAMVASDVTVRQLVFGYASAAAALAALDGKLLDGKLLDGAVAGDNWLWLVERLQEFASGIDGALFLALTGATVSIAPVRRTAGS